MPEAEVMDFEGELQRAIDADPFIPFDIVMTSGDRYHITESDQVSVGSNMVTIFFPKIGYYFLRKNQMVAVHVQA